MRDKATFSNKVKTGHKLNTMKQLSKSILPKSLVIILLLFTSASASSTPAQTQPIELDKQLVAQEVAHDWLAVAAEQYKRGLYQYAEQSLLQANQFQQHLNTGLLVKISELLKKTHTAVLAQADALNLKTTANGLIQQGKLIEAKAHLEKIRTNRFLSSKQRTDIVNSINQLNGRIIEEKRVVAGIYKNSVKSYNAGNLKEARNGFINVAKSNLFKAPKGKSPNDYILNIDKILTLRAERITPQAEPGWASSANYTRPGSKGVQKVTSKNSAPIAVGSAEAAGNILARYKHKRLVANERKSTILQSYVKAVINDATTKVQDYIKRGEFDSAEEAVESARQLLIKKRPKLRDASFTKYNSQIKQLTENIDREKTRFFGDWDNRTAWRL